MKGHRFLWLILLSTTFISYSDENLIKSLKLITTLNKAYLEKATEYVKDAAKKNDQTSRQKIILHDFIKIGDFLQLGRSEQISLGPKLNIEHKIFRKCFTCKGTRYLERKKRCTTCKANGKCVTCGGDGKTTSVRGAYIYFYTCNECTSGKCPSCEGTRYVGGDCDKCYLTDGSIDSTKTKFVLLKLLKEYIGIEKSKNKKVLAKERKNDENKRKNAIDISFVEVQYSTSRLKGIFIRNKEKLEVVFSTSKLIDPTKLKCTFEGRKFKYSQVSYSEKYNTYKLTLEQKFADIPTVKVTSYDRKSSAYLMTLKKSEPYFTQIKSLSDIKFKHVEKGILIAQDRKVCGFLYEESIINRTNVSTWFKQGGFYKNLSKVKVFRTDFESSFKVLKNEDLDFDMLFLSQYLEEEQKLLHQIFNNKIKSKDQLGLEYLKDLKQSFSKNNWKTTWGEKVAKIVIDTISQLEAVKF